MSEIKENININKFLKDGSKNQILIHFNKEYFYDKMKSELDFNDFKGKWIFIESGNSRDKLLFSKNFIINQDEFKIIEFYDALNQAHGKWESICPLIPFPDIVIVPNDYEKKYSAFVSYDKLNYRHIIFLTFDELLNLNRFKFVLGHELGHIYYFIVKKREVDARLEQQKYSKFFPWIFHSILLLSCFFYLKLIITEPDPILRTLCILQIFIWSIFLIAQHQGFERIKNYSSEFFADFFSFCFAGKCSPEDMGLSKGSYNLFTHPASKLRIRQLKEFKESSNIEDWINPVEHRPIYYKTMNFYEISYFIELMNIKLFKKVSGFWSKKEV